MPPPVTHLRSAPPLTTAHATSGHPPPHPPQEVGHGPVLKPNQRSPFTPSPQQRGSDKDGEPIASPPSVPGSAGSLTLKASPAPRHKAEFVDDFMGDDGRFAKILQQTAELQSAQLQQLRNGSSTTPQGRCADCTAAGKSCFLSQSFLEKHFGAVIGKRCSFGGDDDEGCGCKVSRHN